MGSGIPLAPRVPSGLRIWCITAIVRLPSRYRTIWLRVQYLCPRTLACRLLKCSFLSSSTWNSPFTALCQNCPELNASRIMSAETYLSSTSSGCSLAMNESIVRERIQCYFDDEISLRDLRHWAYDNIPTRLEYEELPGVDYDAFWMLFAIFCEYDYLIEFMGFSKEKAEDEFRLTLTERLAERKVKTS